MLGCWCCLMCWVSWIRSPHFSWPTTLARSNSGQTPCLGWTCSPYGNSMFPSWTRTYQKQENIGEAFLSLNRFHLQNVMPILTGSKLGVGSIGGPTASMGAGWTEAPDQRKGGSRQGPAERLSLKFIYSSNIDPARMLEHTGLRRTPSLSTQQWGVLITIPACCFSLLRNWPSTLWLHGPRLRHAMLCNSVIIGIVCGII